MSRGRQLLCGFILYTYQCMCFHEKETIGTVPFLRWHSRESAELTAHIYIRDPCVREQEIERRFIMGYLRMLDSELAVPRKMLDRSGVAPHDREVPRTAFARNRRAVKKNHQTDSLFQAILAMALKVGFCESDMRALAKDEQKLRKILSFLRGVDHLVSQDRVDCDADPFIPSALSSVVSHQSGGQFLFDIKNISLYLSPHQKNEDFIKGDMLQRELANKHVLNANVLDYLLAHPNLIPEAWKGKKVFFWGTIYLGTYGLLTVRSLVFCDNLWRPDYYWINFGWFGNYFAAIRTMRQ